MVQVILVCSGADASLEQEMQLLEAAKEAAGSSSAVFGFIVQPSQVSRFCHLICFHRDSLYGAA